MAKAQSANLVSIPVPNFITGVSQQPAHLRLATSVDAMENCWASVISGASKRPPTQYLAKLRAKLTSTAAGTIIDNNPNSLPMIVTIADGDLFVHDIEGTPKTVTFPNGKEYLTANDPASSFRFLNIQDTTFILNRERQVRVSEYGEPNESDFQPDGQVYSKDYLPDPNTVAEGVIYETYSDGKLWKVVYNSATEALCRWDAQGAPTTTKPTDGLPIVPTVRYNDGYAAGSIVYLKTDTVSYTTVTNWVFINGSLWPVNSTVAVTTTTYQKYIKTLVNPARPAFFEWVEKTRTEIVTELKADRMDPTHCASVYVQASAGNTYYTIYIDGKLVASYLTDTNVDATKAMETTDMIARGLCDGKVVPPTATADKLDPTKWTKGPRAYLTLTDSGYTWIRTGSTITITNFPADGKILSTSSQGDTLVKCCYNMVRQFSDLPPQSPHGRMIVVGGDIESGGDDYTVWYDTATRQWKETYWYGRGASLNPDTMPWVLLRNPDGSFTFKKHYWRNRPAGDQDSNPHPRFSNERLNDMFLYAGRMGFITNSNIIFSGASHFEQFYRSTVASLQDDDRLDLIVATQNDDSLRHVISYSRDLLIMADKSQYRFQYQQYLGPKNVQVSFTTSFYVSKHISPVNMGASVFFADDSSSYRYAKVYEYFPRPNSQGDDAEEITEPVPSYVPSGLTFLASSPRTNMLFCGTKNDTGSIYVYKYLWAGDKKVQSAWSKWTFTDASKVYWAKVNRNFLYCLVERSGFVYLERIQIDEQSVAPDVVPDIYLDMRSDNSKLTITYNATDKHTYVKFPYTFTTKPEIVVTDATTKVNISERVDTKLVDTTTVKIKGDFTNFFLVGGIPYTMSMTISCPLVRTQAGSGVTAVLDGRLMVRWFNLEYHRAIGFKIRVQKRGYNEEVIYHETNRIDDPDAHLDQSVFERGTVKAPVMGNNLDTTIIIENDQPHNAVFASGEWWAVYQPRTRRL